MIKVNLLPVKEKKKRKQVLVVAVSVFFAVIALAGLGWFYFQKLQVVDSLNDQIKQVDQESQGYQDKINEINDFQAKQASLDNFHKMLDSITGVQKVVLFGFDRLAFDLPNGVWISKITQGQTADNNKLTIDGYAFSNLSLQQFLTTLQTPASGFSDTTLDIKSITAAVGNNKQIQQFEIVTRAVPQ